MAVRVPSQSVPLSPSSSSLSRSSNFRRSNRQELCPIQRLGNCSSDTSSKSLNLGEASCMTARSVIISRGTHIKHLAAFFPGQLFSPKLVSGPILLNIPRMHIKHYTASHSAPSSSPELVSPPNLFNMSRLEEEHKTYLGSHLRPRMDDASYHSRSLWRYEKEKLELKKIANSVSKGVVDGRIHVKDQEHDLESVQNGSIRNNPATDFDRQSESAMRQTDRDRPTESQPLNPVGDIKGHVSDSVGARHNDSTINGCSEHSPDKAPFLEKHDILKGDHKEKLICIYEKVLVVDDITTAKKVVQMLITKYKNIIHACDTEVANIDVKEETPVDHGEIICLSIYSGPEVDFGNGKNCIWVDVLDGGRDVFMEFAPFFEDPSIKKVWHNYSFDAHVIENYGIKLSGFHADTMHLARLWDSSRRIDGGYSLEALTCDPKVMNRKKATQYEHADGPILGKLSMKSIFGKKKMKKDGSDGKKVTIDPVELLQRGEERIPWIGYSVLDSIYTLELFDSLKEKLQDRVNGISKKTMYDFYEEYWRQFGFLLVKMESEGMLVDRAYLSEMEKVAIAEQQIAADRFRKWASKYCPDAKYMNVGSDIQIRQLLFGGIRNRKDAKETLPLSKTFKVPNTDKVIEEGKKAPSKFRTITLHHLGFKFHTETYTPSGWPSVSRDALKASLAKMSSDQITLMNHENELQSDMAEQTLGHQTNSEDGKCEILGSGSNFSTSNLATSYHSFKGDEGKEACDAIAALCEICSIDSLISNFIIPLQGNHISGKNGRIHCSLNINTETGRLSARRPSLQNQPALEKDRYKIRKAFIAESGKSLIVADYGQLELRILAHLADCKSMLEAFKAGGDFHSRTAINMYDHVRKAVDEKRVLLEWHPQPGEDKPPVPLLKDAFASERRKAKMLNFSIAYGKTAVGLSKDWKVSVEEAKQTLTLWYSRRKEVRKWQLERKKEAHNEQCVYTLLGRARNFPSMTNASNSQRGHIERAAINAPVQGSAADVAMCAMLEIDANTQLKDLGWKLLLQVHDEVILEGPTESAEIAKVIVVDCMSKPFNGKNILKVDLTVDAKCAKSWYDAK